MGHLNQLPVGLGLGTHPEEMAETCFRRNEMEVEEAITAEYLLQSFFMPRLWITN